MEREKIEFDVLFIGGGPASLAGAIRLVQLAKERGREIEVAVIEKGSEIGSHALSGAILNPIALVELIPDYRDKDCPIETTVRGDEFYFLTSTRSFRVPIVPRYMHNNGMYVISLARFTRWLGNIAEESGINIFPGFTGKEVLIGDDGKTIIGVRTGDKGLGKDGKPKGNFEPGIDLISKITIFGEGARGSLIKEISDKLNLYAGKMPQVFETGIKEVIQLPEDHYFKTSVGNDIHTLGYPLGLNIPGGGFLYEMSENKVAIGFLTGLSYDDPMLDPYTEFIKFKKHPFISKIIKGGKILEQGARTVATGGYFTMPRLAVNGAMFIGGCAGIHNPPALKGIHLAMKSGMLAAETAMHAIEKDCFDQTELSFYVRAFDESWANQEVFEGRNFSAALAKKIPIKFIHLGAQYVTRGKGFRDPLLIEEDCMTLKPVSNPCECSDSEPSEQKPDAAVEFDGELYVDKLTGVFLSRTIHREDQPSHILIHDLELCVGQCYETYRNPCTRFCPGKVYEMEEEPEPGKRRLKLNPANCLHCKTCDVKDPYRNITWTCPEGGEGPEYSLS